MLSSGLSAQFIVLCSAAAYIEHSLLGPSSNLRTTSQNFVLSQRLLDGRTVCLSDIAWFCRREVLSEVRLDNQLRSRVTLGDILSNRFVRYTTKPTLSRRHYRPHPGSDCRSDSGMMAYISSIARQLGNFMLAMGVMIMGIAAVPYRRGEKWARYISWILPIVIIIQLIN